MKVFELINELNKINMETELDVVFVLNSEKEAACRSGEMTAYEMHDVGICQIERGKDRARMVMIGE